MTLVDALGQVFIAVTNRLAGQAEWTAAYLDLAPAEAVAPFVVYFVLSGGRTYKIRGKDLEITLGFKCVSDSQGETLTGKAKLVALLVDQGSQDGVISPLDAGSAWEIINTKQGFDIHMVEEFENASPVYSDGIQVRFRLETK